MGSGRDGTVGSFGGSVGAGVMRGGMAGGFTGGVTGCFTWAAASPTVTTREASTPPCHSQARNRGDTFMA